MAAGEKWEVHKRFTDELVNTWLSTLQHVIVTKYPISTRILFTVAYPLFVKSQLDVIIVMFFNMLPLYNQINIIQNIFRPTHAKNLRPTSVVARKQISTKLGAPSRSIAFTSHTRHTSSPFVPLSQLPKLAFNPMPNTHFGVHIYKFKLTGNRLYSIVVIEHLKLDLGTK